MRITPHRAQNNKRAGGSAIDQRTSRHAGYAVSQQVEQSFVWRKKIGLLKKAKLQGLRQASGWFTRLVFLPGAFAPLVQEPSCNDRCRWNRRFEEGKIHEGACLLTVPRIPETNLRPAGTAIGFSGIKRSEL